MPPIPSEFAGFVRETGVRAFDTLAARAADLAPPLRQFVRSWKRLSDEDKKIFSEVAQEAAARATAEIQAKEKELIGFFKEKGLTVSEVNKDEFKETVLKNVAFEQFGYRKAEWERIQAVKAGS